MTKMDRLVNVILMFVVFFVHRTHEFGFNPLTFIKNWSLKGSASYPMPKGFLDTKNLISREGYGWETFPVETEDGYQLTVTRILPQSNLGRKKRRPPILMVHGLLATSEGWVPRGRDEDLAFLLTELGYDIWLADLRGNYYGKHHKYLSPGDPRFWDFSFHEVGVYDLPAMIDMIIAKTGFPKIGYIGHSMGTTVFFVMASVRPEYNNKIWGSVLLAPVASKYPLEEITSSMIRVLLAQYQFLADALKSAGIYEMLPRTPRLVYNVKKYCTHQPEQDYCLDIIGQFYGEHRANLDRKRFGNQMSYIPAGSSVKTVQHFGQVYNHGFYMFDYGMKGNKLKYNSTIPPAYPLQLITTPIILLYGINDALTSSQGVAFLRDMVPGVRKVYQVPDYKFTHIDFILGNNTNETINGVVFEFLKDQLTR